MRDGRADEEHIARALEALVHEILGIYAAGGQESRILCPQHAGAQDAHPLSAPLKPGASNADIRFDLNERFTTRGPGEPGKSAR